MDEPVGPAHTDAMSVPPVGELLPRGWRLAAALSAGLLWLWSAGMLALVPTLFRQAHLYRQRTDEGVLFAQVGLDLLAATGLLALAQKVSVVAHGDAARAPRSVLWTRRLTWVVVAVVWLAALVLSSTLQGQCFRTCAPFPQ